MNASDVPITACPMKYSDLTPSGPTTRHCRRCERDLFDLSAMTKGQIDKLLVEALNESNVRQSPCVSYAMNGQRQIIHHKEPPLLGPPASRKLGRLGAVLSQGLVAFALMAPAMAADMPEPSVFDSVYDWLFPAEETALVLAWVATVDLPAGAVIARGDIEQTWVPAMVATNVVDSQDDIVGRLVLERILASDPIRAERVVYVPSRQQAVVLPLAVVDLTLAQVGQTVDVLVAYDDDDGVRQTVTVAHNAVVLHVDKSKRLNLTVGVSGEAATLLAERLGDVFHIAVLPNRPYESRALGGLDVELLRQKLRPVHHPTEAKDGSEAG